MAGSQRMPQQPRPAAPKPDVRPRLAADPKSPFFARAAADYLGEGRTREALALCVEGTKIFPRYATGSLVLGKCYEALGQWAEALAEYRRVLDSLPDSVFVRGLAEKVEQLEERAYGDFSASVARELQDRKDGMTFEEFATGAPPPPANTVEFLIKQLQQAPRTPRPAVMPVTPIIHEEPPAPVEEPHSEEAPTIVTETLAEIYANQGQYREAIQAYTTLSAEKPEDADRFAERIAQLQELLRLQGDNPS